MLGTHAGRIRLKSHVQSAILGRGEHQSQILRRPTRHIAQPPRNPREIRPGGEGLSIHSHSV